MGFTTYVFVLFFLMFTPTLGKGTLDSVGLDIGRLCAPSEFSLLASPSEGPEEVSVGGGLCSSLVVRV